MRLPPRTISALLCVFVVLLPPARYPSRRDIGRDVRYVRRAECEYRGITGSFEDVTRAYVLETYDGSELIGWKGEPSRSNPESETLVTAWYRVDEAKPVVEAIVPDSMRTLRRHASPRLPIIWRYGTLAGVRIEAANDYARDAIAVFRLTVDRFIRSMVVAESDLVLRTAPAPNADIAHRVGAGTVLLREIPLASATPVATNWSYVRVPSTTRCGWAPTERLKPVQEDER